MKLLTINQYISVYYTDLLLQHEYIWYYTKYRQPTSERYINIPWNSTIYTLIKGSRLHEANFAYK